MAQFRKLPVIISAFPLGRNWPMDECNEWFHKAITDGVIETYNMGKMHDPTKATFIIIRTLEGDMRAELGDYIIRGINGEIYPCKPAIFEKTYEAV